MRDMKKITITEKQAIQFNFMRAALVSIAKEYQTPEQLRRDSEKQYGLAFEEAIEYAYDNIQAQAKFAAKNVKAINLLTP